MTRTMRTLTAAGAVAAALLMPTPARAQTKPEFGSRGEFILSADRLVPLVSWSRVAQDDLAGGDTSTTTTQTAFSFFWGSTAPQEVFFTVPRVGLDYTIVPNVTIGGNVTVFFTAGSNTSTTTTVDNGAMTTSGDNGGLFVFGIEPRAGYILRLNDMFAFWFRGGFSFYTATASSPKQNDGSYSHDNTNQFALDLEPQFVFTPVSHFGLTATLDGDVPIAGQHSHTDFAANGMSNEASASSSLAFVGLTLGMIGYF
jgi:hypothetical protein